MFPNVLLARAICADRPDDLALAFARLALPTPAREYMLEKLAHVQVLITGLGDDDRRLLRALTERESSYPEEFPAFVVGDKKRPGTALLTGRRDQLERLTRAIRERERPALAEALDCVWSSLERPGTFTLGAHALQLGRRTQVMGVVNVTPDSFSDGGRFHSTGAAVAQGEALAKAGADLLDIGGESTRPGAQPVSVEEEQARVVPVIEALRARVQVPISVDTRKAEVARAALAAGASLVNDVSALQFDPGMGKLVADTGAALCLMHIQGTPETMQKDPRYGDVVEEVTDFLAQAIARARAAGVDEGRLLVDPGIGFGKTVGHNLILIRRLNDLRVLGRPIVLGTSRKWFLGQLTGGKPAAERVVATAASLAAAAVLGGADIVRVHDVAEAKDALAVADAVRAASEGGQEFEPPPLGRRRTAQ